MNISKIRREMEEGKYNYYEISTSSMSKADITNLIVTIEANNLRIISDLSKVGGNITIAAPLKTKDIIEEAINNCEMYGCSEINISGFTPKDYEKFKDRLANSNLEIYERKGFTLSVVPKQQRRNINTRDRIMQARNHCKDYGFAEIPIVFLEKEQIEIIKSELPIYGLTLESEDNNKLTVRQDEKEKKSEDLQK